LGGNLRGIFGFFPNQLIGGSGDFFKGVSFITQQRGEKGKLGGE